MTFQDSPEVAARRAEVDARLGPLMQQLARRNAGIDLNALRVGFYLEYIAGKLGARDEVEMGFLNLLDRTIDDAEQMLNKATLLAPGPAIQAR